MSYPTEHIDIDHSEGREFPGECHACGAWHNIQRMNCKGCGKEACSECLEECQCGFYCESCAKKRDLLAGYCENCLPRCANCETASTDLRPVSEREPAMVCRECAAKLGNYIHDSVGG